MYQCSWIPLFYYRDWVILRPSWLADITKPLFRPDFGDPSGTEDALKQLGISHQKFERMKKDMMEDGKTKHIPICQLGHLYQWLTHQKCDLNLCVEDLIGEIGPLCISYIGCLW